MPNPPVFGFTDYAQQLQNIERRRKLAEALFQQGTEQSQGPPAVGGIQSPMSPLQPLAQMLKLGLAGYGMNKAEKKSEELGKQRQADLANALKSMGVTDPSVQQMLNMPETASMGQNQIQMQLLKNALNKGNPMNPGSANPSVMAQGGMGVPPAPLDLLGAGDMGKTAYEAINKFNQPVNVRPGGTVYIPGQGPQFTAPNQGVQTQWGPQGPVAGPVPGAQEAQARGAGLTTGAQEAAKFPYQPLERASGAKVPPIVQPVNPANPSQPHSAPADKVTTDPWQSVPQLPMPKGVGQSTLQKATSEHAATTAKELFTKYGTRADEANTRKAFNDQALDLVDRSDVGPGSDFITGMKSFATSRLGIPESDFAKTPSANISLNKDLKNAALQKGRQLFGSRFTQSEVGIMLNQAAPSAQQTRAAIKFLLQSDNAQLGYQTQQANDLGRYMHSGGDPYQFEGWYSKTFPMSKAMESVDLGRLTASAKTTDDLVNKWLQPSTR